MKRLHLIELEDISWWPRQFRDAVTDYLATATRATRLYAGFIPRLASALTRSGTTRITDLCSGGGGPWAELIPALRLAGTDVAVQLTDKYPNTEAFGRIASQAPEVRFETESVSATAVPERLTGFRTLFTSFHHFRPTQAQAILAAAVRDRQGIAVAETTSRTPGAIALMLLTPLVVWLVTPAIRPFRWSRLFWTYLLPVVPIAVMFDGIVSCLRTYTPDEMLAMAREIDSETYDWEAGVESAAGLPIRVPYLIGIPREQVSAAS